jgi:hypothetical protein
MCQAIKHALQVRNGRVGVSHLPKSASGKQQGQDKEGHEPQSVIIPGLVSDDSASVAGAAAGGHSGGSVGLRLVLGGPYGRTEDYERSRVCREVHDGLASCLDFPPDWFTVTPVGCNDSGLVVSCQVGGILSGFSLFLQSPFCSILSFLWLSKIPFPSSPSAAVFTSASTPLPLYRNVLVVKLLLLIFYSQVDIVICPDEVNSAAMNTSVQEKGKSGLKRDDKIENSERKRILEYCVLNLLEQAADSEGPFLTSLAGPKSLWGRCMEPWRGCFPRQPLLKATCLQVFGPWLGEQPLPPNCLVEQLPAAQAKGPVSTAATSDLLFHFQQPTAEHSVNSSHPAPAVAPPVAPGGPDSKGAPSAPCFLNGSIASTRSVTDCDKAEQL